MKINLSPVTTSCKAHRGMMYNLISEFFKEWNINMSIGGIEKFILSQEGMIQFEEWLMVNKSITAKFYDFGTAFTGFDVLEDEHVVAYMLSYNLENV